MTAMRKVQIARTTLILEQPFFGSLSLRLELQVDNSQPAMCTNGRILKFNEKWVDSVTPDELTGVVAHEVLHCSNLHMTRRMERDPENWNIACDRAINPVLSQSGFKLPPGGYNDPADLGKSAEKIYSEIQQQPKKSGNKPGKGQGSGKGQGPGQPAPHEVGAFEDPEIGEHPETMEAEWEVATIQAANAAKAAGKLPAGMERLLERIRKPKVDWKAVLRRFIQQNAKRDYTWSRPNPRFVQQGLYLPTLRSETMPPIIWAVDTSGSVSPEMMEKFAAEMQGAADEVCPEETTVIYCDAKIPHRRDGSLAVDTFGQHEDIVVQAAGGGGTCFKPVFDYVAKEGLEPACLIYLTDMYASDWGSFHEPGYPVLWATISEKQDAPFGEIVPIEDEDGQR